MKLAKSTEDIIESVYYGDTNMDESKDMNLHSAVFAFVDKNNIKQTWTPDD